MTSASDSPLARALAALEQTMNSRGPSSVDPDRRRAAHRLGELVRSSEEDLAGFAERHLPGRQVSSNTLTDAHGLASNLEKLIALLGRSPDADALVSSLASEVATKLPELERAAAPVTPPVLARALEGADAPPLAAERVDVPELPTPAAPFVSPMAADRVDVLEPPTPAAPLVAPTPTPPRLELPAIEPLPVPTFESPVAPGAPLNQTLDGLVSVSPALFESLPFSQRVKSQTKAFGAIAESALGSVPRALPFEGSSGPPASSRSPGTASSALPFRASSSEIASPLPEHLRKLEPASYATFRALWELFPARRGELYQHYRVPDEATSELLHAHFRWRCESNAAFGAEVKQLYEQALAHYRPR